MLHAKHNYHNIQKQLCSPMLQYQYFNDSYLKIRTAIKHLELVSYFYCLTVLFPSWIFLTPRVLVSLDASEKFQLQLKHWFSIICCFVGRIHLTTEMSLTGLWLFTGCTESTGGSCKHWGLKVQSLPKAKGILTSSSGKPADTLGVWYDRERLMIVKSKNKCSHFKHLAQWNTFTTTQPEAPNDQLVKGIEISYVLLMESHKQPEDSDITTTCKWLLTEHDTTDSLFWHSGTTESIAMILLTQWALSGYKQLPLWLFISFLDLFFFSVKWNSASQ